MNLRCWITTCTSRAKKVRNADNIEAARQGVRDNLNLLIKGRS